MDARGEMLEAHPEDSDIIGSLFDDQDQTNKMILDQPEADGTAIDHQEATDGEQRVSWLLPPRLVESDRLDTGHIERPAVLQEQESGSRDPSKLHESATRGHVSPSTDEHQTTEGISSQPPDIPDAHDKDPQQNLIESVEVTFNDECHQQGANDDSGNGSQHRLGTSDQHDSSTLFIPEHTPPSSLPLPPQPNPSTMQPPPRPRPTVQSASISKDSTFAKIRNMQKHLKKSRGPTARPRHNYEPLPDAEAYLEAAQSLRSASEYIYTKEDYNRDDRKAVEEYQRQKNKYDQMRQANGKLTFREDVEWMKIDKAERERKQKRKRDEEKEKEDGGEIELFPSSQDFQRSNERGSEDAADIDPQRIPNRDRPAMPHKSERNLSIQEAELQSMRVALDANGDQPQKKRKASDEDASSAASSVRSRTRSKGSKTKGEVPAASGGSSRRARQTMKEKKATQDATRQMTSLFTSDIFRNQPAEDAPDQPTFTSRNKSTALKELISSLPTESMKAARSDMAALMMATKDFDGHGSVRATDNGMWLVRGMKTSLKHYQVMGTAFMRRRENAEEEPRGGLLADQMGLGKTLMTLANIVNGYRKGSDCKTTLLIASPALITQWGREIELHTNLGLKVMRYASGNRIESNFASQIILSHDVVLTTYAEVMRSYPKHEPPIDCQTTEQKLVWWHETFDKERGILHRIMFNRVVLDEAQAIKNHTSRTSIACRALMARHKWALSGTPVLNRLEELYPYFKFLGVPHTGSFKIFKNNYCGGGDKDSQERLLVRLSQFMMRRSHEDVIFDAPILKLPKASQLLHHCEFNSVERAIYEIVRQRFAKRINMWAKKGELERSYGNALVMLLRLRQLTAHVLMLQYVMQDLLEREDIEQIRDVVQNAAADEQTRSGRIIIAIRKQLEDYSTKKRKRRDTDPPDEHHDGPDEPDERNEPNDGDVSNASTGAKDARTGAEFGKHFNFKPYLKSLTSGQQWEEKKQKSSCGSCGHSPPMNPWKTSCGHLICGPCYDKAFVTEAEQGRDSTTCHACGQNFLTARLLDEDEVLAVNGPRTRLKKQRDDKIRERMEQQDISEEWLKIGERGVLPSAKTIAVKAQILNWIQKDAEVKIIIYTQFLAMITILAKMCQEEGWKTEKYHGKMSFNARDKAIAQFADNAQVRVLLASLRCGGLGLNLTMASRVIVIDPWWNKAVEQQAFCRVYRFGQQQKTFLTKFCVKNTVDDRLVEMQEKKQKEIDEVMDDKNETAKKLSVRDLMRLFGNLDEDSTGRPFIMVDNPNPAGGFAADQDDEGYADDI